MLIVPLQAEGAQLVVRRDPGDRVFASVHLGDWPSGKPAGFVSVYRRNVRVYNPAEADPVAYEESGGRDIPSLWFGDFSPDLAWLKLLQVADFLQLEIPLPHPLPGGEPAGEARA